MKPPVFQSDYDLLLAAKLSLESQKQLQHSGAKDYGKLPQQKLHGHWLPVNFDFSHLKDTMQYANWKISDYILTEKKKPTPLYGEAIEIADNIVDDLLNHPKVVKVAPFGSYFIKSAQPYAKDIDYVVLVKKFFNPVGFKPTGESYGNMSGGIQTFRDTQTEQVNLTLTTDTDRFRAIVAAQKICVDNDVTHKPKRISIFANEYEKILNEDIEI